MDSTRLAGKDRLPELHRNAALVMLASIRGEDLDLAQLLADSLAAITVNISDWKAQDWVAKMDELLEDCQIEIDTQLERDQRGDTEDELLQARLMLLHAAGVTLGETLPKGTVSKRSSLAEHLKSNYHAIGWINQALSRHHCQQNGRNTLLALALLELWSSIGIMPYALDTISTPSP